MHAKGKRNRIANVKRRPCRLLCMTTSDCVVRLASLRLWIKATQPLRESGFCQNPLILRCVAASLMLSRGVRSSALPLRRDLKFPQSTMIGCNQSVHRPSGTEVVPFARAFRLSRSGLLSCSLAFVANQRNPDSCADLTWSRDRLETKRFGVGGLSPASLIVPLPQADLMSPTSFRSRSYSALRLASALVLLLITKKLNPCWRAG